MKDMDVFNGTSEEPTPTPGRSSVLPGVLPRFASSPDNLELIEEIIKSYQDHPQGLLPGPPPPPSDSFSQPPANQNLRSLQSSPSSTSQPVLVPRGTSCPSNFPLQHTACSSSNMASSHLPHFTSGRGRGASCVLPGKAFLTSPSHCSTESLEQILEKPRLVVVEEPKDRGMRFRYQCEGRSAGSILGASSTDSNKTQPTIEIQGPIDHIKRVTVTVSLVTKDIPHRPHPHCLVGKDCPSDAGICVVSFNPHGTRRHSFANLGIQCVRRKELDQSLQKRRSQNIDPFQTGHSKGIEDMDMNAVRLCFQCELEWDDGRKDSLCPVVSKPIFDKKATTTSELKICNLNLYEGSCRGKTEVYMLCDKVQKDDIEILFRRGSWKANGEFAQTDVHRQIAIVFKTPPYQDQDITEKVEVVVVLRRISDQMESEPITFTYTPHNPDPYEVKRKKATIKRDISATGTPPPSEQNFVYPCEPQIVLPPEEIMPDTSMQDPYAFDEQAMKDLIDLMTEQGFPLDLGLHSTSAFANLNMNVNMNYSSYQTDISQIHDYQFNMLVNESQNAQEPQDSMMQVKKEEDL